MGELLAQNKIKSCIFTFKSKNLRKTSFTVDFTAALNLPIIDNPVLDETLDSCKILLTDITKKDYQQYFSAHGLDVTVAFEVNTLVEIKFLKLINGIYVEQQSSIKMRIAHDDCRVQRKTNNKYRSYKHAIQLIELTKELERYSVDTLTFTNPIPREFNADSIATWSGNENAVKIAPELKMVHALNSVIIIAGNQHKLEWLKSEGGGYHVKFEIESVTITVTNPLGVSEDYNLPLTEVTTSSHGYGATGTYLTTSITVTLNRTGVWSVSYTYVSYNNYSEKRNTFTATTQISVTTADMLNSVVSLYTLKDTITRLLNTTPLRTATEQNIFKFNAEQLEKFKFEESPEFAFTGFTLFEALLQIASYKGAFPCLSINDDGEKTISFRGMWNGEKWSESDLPTPIDEISSSDIEQYCTHIECEVQNIVGLNNSQVGSVVEPYDGGFLSTRAGSGSEISQDTALISTHYPMYLHTEEFFADNSKLNSITEYNITPYIYESGDYEALSDYYFNYPDSKVYALKWVQMAENITELAHRLKSVSSLDSLYIKPALANILKSLTGEDYSTGVVGYISSLIDLDNSNAHGFANLMFRSKYVPLINARIKQYKDNFSAFHYENSIKYNQTAELVDSEMLGEHLKELMRKLGNCVRTKIYKFETLDAVPKPGTLIGDQCIYDIKRSIRENEVIATISTVKYAELSRYIGVKNAWKDSDVSIDKCYERQISYNEFLLFTHDATLKSTSPTLTELALHYILPSSVPHTLTCVQATGYNNYAENLHTVLLPVVSLAIGNSILFHWKYKNNYSAGFMSLPAPDGATSVSSGTKYDRAQRMVKYTDDYGRLERISYTLMPTGPVADGENLGWEEETSIVTSKAYVALKIAHSLPLMPDSLMTTIKYYGSDGKEYTAWVKGWSGNSFISVNDLQIEKNSSEALTFETQFHYCTDITTETENTDFIIGSGLSNFCPLVGGNAVDLAIYAFTERLNIFNRHISINNPQATQIAMGQLMPLIQTNGNSKKLKIDIPIEINAKNSDGSFKYKSWAYVGRVNSNGSYQIIFGENKGLDETVGFNTTVYLLPMHKLEDFI